jgi:nitrite reductase (NADH) small subunit
MIGDWLDIGPTDQIAPGNARTLPVRGGEEIAVFHTLDNQFYALVNKCPHKHGPLSQGIVHGHVVTCPRSGPISMPPEWSRAMPTARACAP